MLRLMAELSSLNALNNMSKAESSTSWEKLSLQLICYLTCYCARWSQLSVSVFPAFSAFSCGQFVLWFCEFWKLKMMINPEVMMILLIISQEFGLLEVDNSSTSHSKEWKLFYVNEIKKITKRIILKIFPRNFRLLLRCRL